MRGFLLAILVVWGLWCEGQSGAQRPPCPNPLPAKNAGYSQYLGAAMCRVMTGSAEEREAGLAILREEAKQDNSEAMYMLSSALRVVPDTRLRNEPEGIAIPEKLVAKGSVRAKGALGSLLINGQGLEQDVNRAEAMLNEAASAGDPSATHALFVEYRKGYRLPRDLARSDVFVAAIEEDGGDGGDAESSNRGTDVGSGKR